MLVYSFLNGIISADHRHKSGYSFNASESEWKSERDNTLKNEDTGCLL